MWAFFDYLDGKIEHKEIEKRAKDIEKEAKDHEKELGFNVLNPRKKVK